MTIRQQLLCIIAPHWLGSSADVSALKSDLDALFKRAGWVHFASIAMLPPLPGAGPATRPSLMLELAIDEYLAPELAIERLSARGLDALWKLFGHAGGAVATDAAARRRWLTDFMLSHLSAADGGYIGARDRSVRQVRQESMLYRLARKHARSLLVRGPLDSDVLAGEMRRWANENFGRSWAATPAPRSFWRTGARRRLSGLLIAFALLWLGAAPVEVWLTQIGPAPWLAWPLRLLSLMALLLACTLLLLVTAPLWLAVLTALRSAGRVLQSWLLAWDRLRHRRAAHRVPSAQQVHPTLLDCEVELTSQGRPNHIISLTELRWPRWWHAAMLRIALVTVTWLGRWMFTEGVLGKAAGIKFGHWHLIDRGRRLLFCSNYDGSFGGYLDEFIHGATSGVNLFWSTTRLRQRHAAEAGQPALTRCRAFPPTRCLGLRGGCEHEAAFKAFARDSMLPHLYLFQAYTLSQAEIERATRLRDVLFAPGSAVNDDFIARALES